ncbi:hypothetical protein OBBRIDRAFT_792367 [Obba rivulosa]|uniref:VHS domain-containing protein n=1 Tax=Obba rivulosa TaxID=1052685 RepID=A0A8E2DNT3_9APHY|nr:hypothetical protein OBBRIDRAFT_792367 [Obba rivulosa]
MTIREGSALTLSTIVGMITFEHSAFNDAMSSMHSLFRHVHTQSTSLPGVVGEQRNVSIVHGDVEWLPNALEELRTTLVTLMAPGVQFPEDYSRWFPEICDMASFTSSGCKTAIRTLRIDGFGYFDDERERSTTSTVLDIFRQIPGAEVQLCAAKLWAELLRNCSEYFFRHCGSPAFVNALRRIITSEHSTSIVRDTLLDVLSGAALDSAFSK